MVEITGLKVPKALFGTYLSGGRSVNDATLEVFKGKIEADRTLKSFEDRNSALSSKTLDLQRQLIDATVKVKTVEAQPKPAPQQPFPQIQVEEIDFGALENADLMDPDSHGVVKDNIKKAATAFKNLKTAIETAQHAAKAQPPTDPNVKPYKPEEDQEVIKQRGDLRSSEQQRDLFEIEMAVAQTPAIQMSYDQTRGRRKTFQEVDAEISAFYDKVQQAAGTTGDRMNAVNFYFGTSNDSKIFRDQCVQKGYVPPSDFDKHQVASRAYANRRNDMAALRDEARANPPAQFSIQNYIEHELKATPAPVPSSQQSGPAPAAPQTPQDRQQQIQQHFQQRQAADAPPGVIADIPPTIGQPAVFNPNEAEQSQLAAKVRLDPASLTQQEAAWWLQTCQQLGFTLDEIPQIIRNKVKG